MFLCGKQVVQQLDTPVQPAAPPVASAPEEFCNSTLLFLKDILFDCKFLVDSGASVSVFPGPGVRHHLLTHPGPPVFAKTRRLDQEKLDAAQEEFSAMEKAEILLSVVFSSS